MNGLARFALSDDLGAAWLARLPAGSVDALVVDPSAAPVVRKLGASGAGAGEALGALAWEVGRALAPGRRAMWLCESRHGLGLARLLERYGLEVAPPAIWDRGEGARGGRLRWILAVSKGRARGLPTIPDLIVAPAGGGGVAAALPERIAEVLVMTGSAAGQWILEPFAREPALALAAVRLERSYWGASHVEETRAGLARALHLGGASRLADGPVALRPRGLDIGLGPGAASQLTLDSPSQASLGTTRRADGDEPRSAADDARVVSHESGAPGETGETGETGESPDVRAPTDPTDGVRTGAV